MVGKVQNSSSHLLPFCQLLSTLPGSAVWPSSSLPQRKMEKKMHMIHMDGHMARCDPRPPCRQNCLQQKIAKDLHRQGFLHQVQDEHQPYSLVLDTFVHDNGPGLDVKWTLRMMATRPLGPLCDSQSGPVPSFSPTFSSSLVSNLQNFHHRPAHLGNKRPTHSPSIQLLQSTRSPSMSRTG